MRKLIVLYVVVVLLAGCASLWKGIGVEPSGAAEAVKAEIGEKVASMSQAEVEAMVTKAVSKARDKDLIPELPDEAKMAAVYVIMHLGRKWGAKTFVNPNGKPASA